MMKRLSTIVMMLALMVSNIWAVPANRQKVTVQQPDGSSVTIQLHGDEWLHFTTTTDGYTITQNKQGYYVYAMKENDVLKASHQVAHDIDERKTAEVAFLKNVKKYQQPEVHSDVAQLKQKVQHRQQQALNCRRAAQYDYNKFKGLIILVQWNDKEFSRSDYKEIAIDMVNKENYTGFDNQVYTGSVRDYFHDNSGGKFNPQFDVVGPYTIDFSVLAPKMGYDPDDEKYDADAPNKIVNAIVDAADADVDFSKYDGDGDGMVDLVYFIMAGNGSNYTGNDKGFWWPHRAMIYKKVGNQLRYVTKDGVTLFDYASSVELTGYTTYPQSVKIDGIGTICHEFSHVLGLPDFYDSNYEEDGWSDDPGQWSVMASGCYENDSRTPVGYSLYERYSVGFTEEPQEIAETGNYTLEPLHNSMKGYRLSSPVSKEFFLLENRQKNLFKWDAYLPGSGMLVHRVDLTNTKAWTGNTVNANAEHNYYELLRANGVQKSGGETIASASDAFPGTKNVTELTNGTSPANIKTWDGQSNKYGLYNIKQTNGIITFNVNGYELEELSLPENITVNIGIDQQIIVTPTPLYAEYTLTWESNKPAVATVDNNGVVKGLTPGTCTITATSDTGLSASCEVTVQELKTYTFAEVKNMPADEVYPLNIENATVLFTYTKLTRQTAYLRDATGALKFYNMKLNVKKDDVVNGQLSVKTNINNNCLRVISAGEQTNTQDLTILSGTAAQPREVRLEDLTEADYGDLIIIKGVQLERDNDIWAVSGNHRARVWSNNFGISSGISSTTDIEGKYYNITAIYDTNTKNGAIINELNVTKAVEETEGPSGINEIAISQEQTTNCPRYNLAGQRVDSNYKGLTIKNGKKIVIK